MGKMTGWFVLGFFFIAAPLVAQTSVNPTTVTFDHPDFSGSDSYSVGYFSSASATNPVQEATLAKPSTCAPCSGPLPSRPSGFQTWYVGVRAIAGTLSSPWSSPLVPFVRAPLAPVNVKVQ